MTTTMRLRRPVGIAALGTVLVAGGLPVKAAVLPLTTDLRTDATGPQSTLVPPDSSLTLPGTWVGHTRCGHAVRFDLRLTDNGVVGLASLADLVPDASTPLTVAALSFSGRTLVFRVKACPLGRDATYGILTIVSDGSARLDLQSDRSPISLVLTQVS
jgi:hypothetical protein